MLLLVTISWESAAQTTASSLSIIEGRRMLDVMSKWKVLPIPLRLPEASSGKNEKEDASHALSQLTAHCTSFCQPVFLVQR